MYDRDLILIVTAENMMHIALLRLTVTKRA